MRRGLDMTKKTVYQRNVRVWHKPLSLCIKTLSCPGIHNEAAGVRELLTQNRAHFWSTPIIHAHVHECTHTHTHWAGFTSPDHFILTYYSCVQLCTGHFPMAAVSLGVLLLELLKFIFHLLNAQTEQAYMLILCNPTVQCNQVYTWQSNILILMFNIYLP